MGIIYKIFYFKALIRVTLALSFYFPFQVIGQVKASNGFVLEDYIEAIRNKDTFAIKKHILSIGDASLSDSEFFSIVEEIGGRVGFFYGGEDPEDGMWKKLPKKRREIIKSNIFTVYSLYISSYVFLKKVDRDDMDLFIDKHYNNKALYTSQEKLEIWNALNNMCKADGS